MHLKLTKGDESMRVMMDSKHNDLLLGRLATISRMITEKEDNYISVRKADFLLQEL